ncbi:MAG TPA: hypothetical protein EYH54_03965 [Nautiliaceae bacterium]|nr:hypothetical protein [Nautiliaceae bacterium]
MAILTIFLPKNMFSDYSIKKIIDFSLKKNVDYLLVGEEKQCFSLSNNIYNCISVKEAIMKNKKTKVLFLPGGLGTLKLLDNTLALSYLNSYDPIEDIIFLEREAIFLFYRLGKLYGKHVAKPINIENKMQGCVEIEKDTVKDQNLLTSSKLYNLDFIELIKKILLEVSNHLSSE